MRAMIHVTLDGSERVLVERLEDEGNEDEPWLSIRIGETSIAGPASVMQQWANEIQLAVTAA